MGCFRNACTPHEGNDHLPHVLHPRRLAGYGAAAVAMKCVVIAAAFALPTAILMSDGDGTALERALLVEVHAVRTMHRRAALAEDPALVRSARARAGDMAAQGYFGHVGPNGRTLDAFLRDAPYAYAVAGENLAMGLTDARAIVDAWMRSPTHRAILLAPDVQEIGIGVARAVRGDRPVLLAALHVGRRGMSDPVPAVAVVDGARSSAMWEDSHVGARVVTRVVPRAQVAAARVEAYGENVTLTRAPDGSFEGAIDLPNPPEELRSVRVPPIATLTFTDGRTVSEPLRWSPESAPEVSPRLRRSLTWRAMASFTPVATVLRALYLLAMTVLAFAMVRSIGSELRGRHPRVFSRAALLFALLVLLIVI